MSELALDVAIVAYRCEAMLRECLASLASHPPAAPMAVHVVDNASGDGTAEMVAAEFEDVKLTRASHNLGFAAATNVVIRAGRAPHVLALNPDTRVTAGALDALLAVMERETRVGICGPRLELPDGTFDHAARRGFPTPLSALGHFTGVGRRREGGALAAYRAPDVESGPVDAVNGACMLLRRSALDAVGVFDEGYWMYMEDLDICYRFREAGWATWYEPKATVIHVKAGTSGPIRSPRLNYAFHYGMYRFYRRHYAKRRSPLLNAAVYGGIGLKLGASLVRAPFRRRAPRREAPDRARD